MRPVLQEDGSALNMQGIDVGILEFKTLLTAEGEEISFKMINEVQNLSTSKISIEEIEKETTQPQFSFKQFQSWLDLNPYIRTLVIQSINPQMWAQTEDKLPKWFVNQATVIDVEIESEQLVKLPKVADRNAGKRRPLAPLDDVNMKIAKNRLCLAYTIRLKQEQ